MSLALVVGAALVNDLRTPGRLLAARRSGPPSLAGRWELPGGKVEPGEPPPDALRRELREELGVDVRLGDEIQPEVGAAWPLSERYEMRVWLGSVVAGRPVPLTSHDELRWLAPPQWQDVDWLDGDRPVLAALRRRGFGTTLAPAPRSPDERSTDRKGMR
jgi:8-oxo-dGTP diphosphatase